MSNIITNIIELRKIKLYKKKENPKYDGFKIITDNHIYNILIEHPLPVPFFHYTVGIECEQDIKSIIGKDILDITLSFVHRTSVLNDKLCNICYIKIWFSDGECITLIPYSATSNDLKHEVKIIEDNNVLYSKYI